MKLYFKLIFLLFFLAGFGQETTSKVPTINNFDPEEFDSYVQQAVKDWGVPGLAIVVVKGDSVLFQKGYGVKELGKKEQVNEKTLFAIASTSKAFAATAIGMLVDEGKLKWDDPVMKHLPQFKLRDPDLTRQITIRDLLTHRAGLPNTDFLWFDPEATTKEIVKKLEHVEAVYPLRSGFIYQNVMYALAGEVVSAASDMPWDEFIRTRIFKPLEMERSYTSRAAIESEANVARPHDMAGGRMIAIEGSYADAIGPAGSMWSSVEDMSRWLRFLLNNCQTKSGENLLKKGTCDEMFKPQVALSGPFYPTGQLTKPNWNTYGLGWFQQDYEGRKIDFHTGSLSGMVALAGMIRDENIGFFVLANLDHTELRHALMYRIFDLFDNDPPRDWSREIKELYDQRDQNQERSRVKSDSSQIAERVFKTQHSKPLEEYTGSYNHPLYGSVKISQQGKILRLQYGGLKGSLEHWHYDTFRFKNDKAESTSRPLIDFDLDSSGKVERLKIYGREFERDRS